MLKAHKLPADFNPQNIKDVHFKTYSEIVNKEDNPTDKLYLSACNFNQAFIVRSFIAKLAEKFGDNLIIKTQYRKPTTIYYRDDLNLKFNTMFTDWTATSITFIINNHLYRLELNSNPLLDGNWFTAHQIFQFDDGYLKDRYFTMDYCLNKPYNINNLFGNIWSIKNDREKDAEALFDYFMSDVYGKSQLPNGNRVYTLANAENEYYIKTISNKEIAF